MKIAESGKREFIQYLCEREVHQLHFLFLVEHDILAGEIPITDVPTMNIPECFDILSNPAKPSVVVRRFL